MSRLDSGNDALGARKVLKGIYCLVVGDGNVLSPADIVEMSVLRSYYPNIMHLDYERELLQADSRVEYTNPFEKRPFRDVMEEFYSFILKREMSEDEWDIVEELAEKAGIDS